VAGLDASVAIPTKRLTEGLAEPVSRGWVAQPLTDIINAASAPSSFAVLNPLLAVVFSMSNTYLLEADWVNNAPRMFAYQ
jgi:hypothetical protein